MHTQYNMQYARVQQAVMRDPNAHAASYNNTRPPFGEQSSPKF